LANRLDPQTKLTPAMVAPTLPISWGMAKDNGMTGMVRNLQNLLHTGNSGQQSPSHLSVRKQMQVKQQRANVLSNSTSNLFETIIFEDDRDSSQDLKSTLAQFPPPGSSKTSSVINAKLQDSKDPTGTIPEVQLKPQEGTPSDAISDGSCTTVMIRNLSRKFERRRLMWEIDQAGFHNRYDYCYLPMSTRKNENRGFAFINFATPDIANMFRARFDGQLVESLGTNRPLRVSAAHIQGWSDNLRHHQAAPFVHRTATFAPSFFRPFCS